MKVNSEVFRAYDIRGIVDEELTPKLVENIGKAIGSEVKAVSNTHLTLPTTPYV